MNRNVPVNVKTHLSKCLKRLTLVSMRPITEPVELKRTAREALLIVVNSRSQSTSHVFLASMYGAITLEEGASLVGGNLL